MPSLDDESLTFEFDETRHPYGYYTRGWGGVIATVIKHPSSTFSAKKWHPIIQKFLATPNKLHAR